VADQLRVGQGFRLHPLRVVERVVFITSLDARYAYVRAERPPHRRSRILRSRLASAVYVQVGEFGDDPSIWPKWFREDAKLPEQSPKGKGGENR
jgi:hypothetical protein